MTVLIIGSGAIGLRTAVELVRRRTKIRLISPQHPLHSSTCSVGAGGLWMPFHCDDKRTDRWAFETLDELMSYVTKRSDESKRPLVEVVPAISFKREVTKDPPGWAVDLRSKALKFQTLTLEDLYSQSMSLNFRLPRRELMEDAEYFHSWLFHPPIVDSPKMLMVSSEMLFQTWLPPVHELIYPFAIYCIAHGKRIGIKRIHRGYLL